MAEMVKEAAVNAIRRNVARSRKVAIGSSLLALGLGAGLGVKTEGDATPILAGTSVALGAVNCLESVRRRKRCERVVANFNSQPGVSTDNIVDRPQTYESDFSKEVLKPARDGASILAGSAAFGWGTEAIGSFFNPESIAISSVESTSTTNALGPAAVAFGVIFIGSHMGNLTKQQNNYIQKLGSER